VYRLSGISSNIQRLKKSFDDEKIPDLYKDRQVLQDIHSVSSLVKLYFRELPSPLCTFQLYDDFVTAVRAPEELRLMKLRETISQLPDANYSTLEFLLKHLHRVSLRHKDTGMTAKNLAIVWAPNLLRSHALEAGGVEALQGVAVQAVVTEYLIKYCHLIFTSPSQNNTPRCGARVSVQAQHSFPISSPIKLLSLAEAQEQYQNMTNKRNHILPIHSLTLNTRKKAKYWSRKTFFSRKREDILSENPLCPCFNGAGSPVQAQTSCCRCLSKFDPDMEPEMETKTLTRPGTDSVMDPEQSPVILRCLRRGTSQDSDPLGAGYCYNKRSSLRDKFRKFALTPISSSHNIIEKFDETKQNFGSLNIGSLAGQHVNQKILHLNESLEFIDASSDEETDTDELSPSVKRSKLVNTKIASAAYILDQKVKTDGNNHVIAASIKGSKTEKCDTNHESEDKTAKNNIDTQLAADKDTHSNKIKSNQINSKSNTLPDNDYKSPKDPVQISPTNSDKNR